MGAESTPVTFLLPDPAHELAGVRLVQDVRIPGDRLDFSYRDHQWQLAVDRPPVSRMEYLFELFRPDGSSQTILDPASPARAEGAFGAKSVREFPGYQEPAWLAAPAEAGDTQDLDLPVPPLAIAGGSGGSPPWAGIAGGSGGSPPWASTAMISVRIWSPLGTPDDEPLPLLIAHDGPEYDSLASLTRYLSAGVAGTWLPRLRAALLSPGSRDRWYSANPGYARALRHVVIPAIAGRVAIKARIGMGASLGALAMLHAHCRFPDSFEALFLESGSFFSPRLDGQERRFPYYRRIVSFVSGVNTGRLPGRPIPVVLTCGTIEENLANNRLIAATLRANGYPARLHEVPDVHNYTAWRDAFDPYLTGLLCQVAT